MRVLLRNPRREIDVEGPRKVKAVLAELEIDPDTVLVICNGTLVPSTAVLGAEDEIEIRPVISGGA